MLIKYLGCPTLKGTIDDLRLYNSAIKEWGMEYLYDQKAFQKVHSGINRNTQNIMGHWKFDGNTADASTNKNDGNLIGGEFVAGHEGNPASALYLDGIDDHVIVPHDDSLNVVDQLSVSMWLKIESFSNIWSPVFHKGGNKLLSGGKDRQYAFWLKNNSIGCLLSAGDNAVQKAHNTKIPVGEWFHYGFSLNRSEKTAKIYLNGLDVVKQGDPYSNFNTFGGDLYIGSNAYVDQFSGLSNFNGTIDDLKTLQCRVGIL